jgi:Alpha-glucosidases, family 31 of glycosyl hydrolases
MIFNIDQLSLFQYNDQDIIMTSSLNYPFYVYGIGERVTNFPLNPGTYTLFSRDAAGPYDDGQAPGKNMYSSQPVYIGLDSAGNAHGGFLLNSNAMDVSVANQGITFRTIGGIVDYFVFVGPRPEDVVKQYQSLVGFPVLTPYWGLGYHQCRWGYNNLNDLQNVVTKFNQYRIPLDVLWTDIDYMNNYEDFTLDASRYNYGQFSKFIDSLHAANRKFVPIMDAAIAKTNYDPYNDGLAKNVFIQSPSHPGALVGDVWPGPAVYIDWFNPNATNYWHNKMDGLRQLVEFDGFWIDMNEPSNFCNGECNYPPSDFVNDIPYTPGQTFINTKTIDLAATHYNGILEYDVHNLYGFKMAIASASYFSDVLNYQAFCDQQKFFSKSRKTCI